MAIPGKPNNFYAQTGNGQNLVSWNLSAGATSYIVQRSLDNITFTTLVTISGSPLATSYLDTAVSLGTQYFYKVAASSSDGTSPYTLSQSVVPTTTGEMCLSQIRLQSQQRADRVNSNFVSLPEWNRYINQSMFELYDMLVTLYEDYYIVDDAPQLESNGTQFQFTLPNGVLTYTSSISGQTITPRPFYKLLGVDLKLNNATNAWVTIDKYNFIDRNTYVFPNMASTIYGVFNMRYRVMGNKITFIPTPSAGQAMRLWYIPRMAELLQDTDITDQGISGWIEYVVVRAAKYALDKEESDTSKLDAELLFLKGRIEETASNRDAGMPDTISNTRQNGGNGDGWGGRNGPIGGF